MICGLCQGNGTIECGSIVTGAEWVRCDGCHGSGQVSPPADPDRIAAAKLAQELLATARELIEEARGLADKHRFMLHFGVIDDRHYFPPGTRQQHPQLYHKQSDGLADWHPWCGFTLDNSYLSFDHEGHWIHSGEYGDCD